MKFKLISLLAFIVSFSAFAEFDHSHLAFDKILKKYSTKKDGQVYFSYKELSKSKSLLREYLKQLESISKKELSEFSNKQKLAFWINAYNAYTIEIILKNYPVDSIKDIGSGLFSSGPWKEKFITLIGGKMSLDNIEHGIIRKEFKEPRIHFAVNCASIGCPSLLQESFVENKLEEQLNRAALNFLTNKNKNYVKGNTLHLSKIFKWYGSDFDQEYGGVQNYIVKTLGLSNKKYKINYNKYDWKLNEL